MARAEAFLPKVERIKGLLSAMRSFDDARALLAQARALEKECGLSHDALQNLDWPVDHLSQMEAVLQVSPEPPASTPLSSLLSNTCSIPSSHLLNPFHSCIHTLKG